MLEPKDKSAYCARGYISYLNANYEIALKDINKAIELDNKFAMSYYYRSLIYEKYNKLEEAIADVSKSLEIDTNNVIFYAIRGTYYAKNQNFNKALIDFNKAIKINPNDSNFYRSRGDVYYSMKNFEKAITDYNKYLDLSKNEVLSYYLIASCYTKLKNYDLAIINFNKVKDIKPDETEADLDISELYLISGQNDKVYKILDQINLAKLDNKNKAIYLFLKISNYIIINKPVNELVKDLKYLLKQDFKIYWDFELTDEWVKLAEISEANKKLIEELTNKLKIHR